MQKEVTEILALARTDAQALGELYERYYERIYRFCVYRLFTRERAEEVTSTIFLQVAGGIRDFTGQTEEDFRCWLYAIASNQVNAYIRKFARQRKLLAAAARQLGKDALAKKEEAPDWPAVYQAMVSLETREQTLVTLRFFENLSFEEIGKILNTSAATLRVALHRVLKKLRAKLQETEQEGLRHG